MTTVQFWIGLQILPTTFLVGLIWIVQLVHYPSFHFVPLGGFSEFEAFHQRRITWVVAPVMLAELVLSLAWTWQQADITSGLNLGSILLIWASTFMLSVPCHDRLTEHPTSQLIDRLILSNWPRTILWTMRLIVLAVFFGLKFRGGLC